MLPLPARPDAASSTALESWATGSMCAGLIVIGLAGEDLVGTIELLEHHDPGQLVREGHRAQRQAHVSVEVEPARAPDDEAEVAAGLAALLEPAAELDRVEGAAVSSPAAP